MCDAPCATCTAANFYSCTSCISASQTLTNSLCVSTSTMIYLIVGTSLAIFFIVPVLMRKRSLILVKILDLIQICSYFKFIVGYTPYRHVWLYLGMRGWGTWEEGWQIISSDPTVPIWTIEEGQYDKLIRIVSIWALFLVMVFLVGIIKVALSEAELTFAKFMEMNIANTLIYGFYFTLQDLSFFVAVSLLDPSLFGSTNEIVCFGLAIFFAIVIIAFIIYSFYRINFTQDDPSEKLYRYKYMFLFSADYDLFPTYNLTQIPKTSKQIYRYSNLRIIDMIKKVVYSFLIVNFLTSTTSYSYLDEIYQLFAFIVFFQLIWIAVFPFDFKKQFSQFILWMLAVGVTLYLLFAPWYIANDIVHSILAMVLFGLAIFSFALQVILDVYMLIPVDLYGTGMKVVIEDTRLLKELALRKKEQEQMERRLKQLQEEKKRLEEEKKNEKEKSLVNEPKEATNRNESEMSLFQTNNKQEEKAPNLIQNEAIEKDSMNSDEIADLYKIDEIKRRRVYEWDKRKPFTYSNKLQ